MAVWIAFCGNNKNGDFQGMFLMTQQQQTTTVNTRTLRLINWICLGANSEKQLNRERVKDWSENDSAWRDWLHTSIPKCLMLWSCWRFIARQSLSHIKSFQIFNLWNHLYVMVMVANMVLLSFSQNLHGICHYLLKLEIWNLYRNMYLLVHLHSNIFLEVSHQLW